MATGFLFLLTVSMCHSSGTNQPVQSTQGLSTTTVLIPKFSPEWQKPYQTHLADFGSFQLRQDLTVHRKNQSDSTQLTTVVYLTGFVSGILWKPMSASANVGLDDVFITMQLVSWNGGYSVCLSTINCSNSQAVYPLTACERSDAFTEITRARIIAGPQ